MDMAVPSPEQEQGKEKIIDLGRIVRRWVRNWWMFGLSLIVCVGLACVYLYKKSPVYLVKGLIMLNQEEEGGVGKSGSLTAMMNLIGSGGGSSSNPENEQMKIMSQTNLTEVVNALGLQYNYWSTSGLLRKKTWLYPDEPVNISLPQAMIDTISVATRFHIVRQKGSKTFEVTAMQGGKKLWTNNVSGFPYRALTPYGTFTVTLTQHYDPRQELDVYAQAVSTPQAVEDLRENLGVNYLSNKADALQVGMEDVNVKRGEDIVNTALRLYNDRRALDRYEHNKAALDFIDNRLLSLYGEIDAQDTKVENFKRDNRLVDAEAEAQYIFGRMGAVDEKYASLKTRSEAFRMLHDMLTNPGTRNSQIPFTTSDLAMSEALGQYMVSYNTLLNKRLELESTAKPGSRPLEVVNEQIEAMRANILNSVDRELRSTNAALADVNVEMRQRDQRMAGMPGIEHKLLSFERDRVIKNQIYAYLLQKREETQIALSQTEPVGKIIDAAYPELKPVSPKKWVVLGIAVFFGLFLPVVWLQLRGGKPQESES